MAEQSRSKRILNRYEEALNTLGDAADALHDAADAVLPPISSNPDGTPRVRLEDPLDFPRVLAAFALRFGGAAAELLSKNGLAVIGQSLEDNTPPQDAPSDSSRQ